MRDDVFRDPLPEGGVHRLQSRRLSTRPRRGINPWYPRTPRSRPRRCSCVAADGSGGHDDPCVLAASVHSELSCLPERRRPQDRLSVPETDTQQHGRRATPAAALDKLELYHHLPVLSKANSLGAGGPRGVETTCRRHGHCIHCAGPLVGGGGAMAGRVVRSNTHKPFGGYPRPADALCAGTRPAIPRPVSALSPAP